MIETDRVAGRGLAIVEDGKGDEAEFILKLGLVEDLPEELGHLRGRVVINPAAESPEHERVVTGAQCEAQHRAELVESTLHAVGGHVRGVDALWMIDSSHSDEADLEGLGKQPVALGLVLTKDSDTGRVNTAEVALHRVTLGARTDYAVLARRGEELAQTVAVDKLI